MATATSRSYATTKRGLAREIKRRRDDCVPMEAARHLLSYDHPGHALVGVLTDAERVVYYHDETASAYALPFDDTGPDADRGVGIATLQERADLGDWIAKMAPAWSWVHPRYRT